MVASIEDPSAGTQVTMAIIGGVFALLASAYFYRQVRSQPINFPDDDAVRERAAGIEDDPEAPLDADAKKAAVDAVISGFETEIDRLRGLIHEGAISFLHTEYTRLVGFVIFVCIVVSLILIQEGDELAGVYTALNILAGATLSAMAGYFGMLIATTANARTTIACATSMKTGLEVSFASGAVMANAVVGLGIMGLSIMFLAFNGETATWQYLSGFGFGASCIALFARVGGGVFTKAADVGADLVGKVENGIPEDDPRNPAVVADNVGDNVGDVAGMGADLFESYVGSIIATATLATNANQVALPFWIAGFGIIVSLVGVGIVRTMALSDDARLRDLLAHIRKGIFFSMILAAGVSGLACGLLLEGEAAWKTWMCCAIGLVAGEVVGYFTEYYTSYEEPPTRDISAASEYGTAPVVIKGLGVGMMSTIVPTVALSATVVACNELGGLYGIAISGVGLLATLGITLATDAYGPVADNAGGIAEMAGLPGWVRNRTDALDSLGNTTAATGKGFAIGSAVLTSVGLIAAYMDAAGLSAAQVSLKSPVVLVGVLIGAMLPFLFAAMTMLSVDRSARAIITEVRLQFAQCPYLMKRKGQTDEEYEAEFARRQVTDPTSENFGKLAGMGADADKYFPDSNRCVAIATDSAIQEMLLPGTMAVFTPAVIGFLLGGASLAGLLVGALTSGFMLALTMSNAGGAWDNAKKWVEKCGSVGEPIDGTDTVVWTTFGVKDVKKAKAVLAEDASAVALARQLLLSDSSIQDVIKASGKVDVDDVDNIDVQAAALAALYKVRKDPVVSGDTVGDPFKDTSGPALNILIKLMSIVSLVLAPTLKSRPNAFEGDSWWVAVIVAVIVAGVCFFAQSRFRKEGEERAAEAVALMSAARKAIAAGALTAGAAVAEPADVEPVVDGGAAAAAEPADAPEDAAAAPEEE